MDSAQKTLISIASLSQQIASTLDRCIGYRTDESFRLDKIVVGCRTTLEVLNKPLFSQDGNADDRLVDWLKGEEPQACLRTLNQMEEILNRKDEYGVMSFFKASRSTHTHDKSNEATRLFRMRKSYFHFLLTTDIWNRESSPQLQPRLTTQPNILPVNQGLDGPGLATAVQPKTGNLIGKQGANLENIDGILKWLNAWSSRGTHERTIQLRQPGTCIWLLKTGAYKRWRSTKNSFLWLHGKPGAGKSVLAASVIEDLRGTARDGKVLAYFYCNFREDRSTSAAEVLRSLLSQLLQQFRRNGVDPGGLIDELVEEKDGCASTLSNVQLLARHVSRAAMQFHEPPFLVIDALDECNDVKELLGALIKLQKDGTRMLAISRPLQIIRDSFSGLPPVDMEAMGYEILVDIRLHVTRELDSHRRLRGIDASFKEEIYSVLCRKAGGMFRWVQCQLDTLKECVTASEVRDALNDLPSDLDETYGRILSGIDRAKREGRVARRALDWLVVALEPLQLSQILDGLSIDLGQRVVARDSTPLHGAILLDALGSLVVYDEVTDIVILSHFSVKEYLTAESTRKKYPAYHVDQEAAHTQLALACLHYIGICLRHHQKSDSYQLSTRRNLYKLRTRRDSPNMTTSHSKLHTGTSLLLFESHPLLQYALSVGFFHLAHVNPRTTAILRALDTFQLDAQQHPLKWKQMCGIARSDSYLDSEHDLKLHILISFGPEPLLHSFIGRTKLQSKDGMNPLTYAVRLRKIEHVRTLLSRGANPNHRGPDTRASHLALPLEVAAWNGDHAMVDLLLDAGSRVPHELFEGALMREYWTCPPRIVSRLLQTDEFVEWTSIIRNEEKFLRALDHGRYRTHSGTTAEQDIDVIERRLVQMGINPSARSNEASLRSAVSAGHVSTVKRMLSLNTLFPSDIILDASRSKNSSSAMIRIFLDMGYQLDVTSPTGDSPLHLVLQPRLSEADCFESVRALVGAGCDLSTLNLDGETPLHIAARHGYVSVVEYLLSLQVPLPPDILLEASKTAMIRLLICQGADARVIAANGNTPLHLALRHYWPYSSDEYVERAEILIGAGCNPCLPNASGETALDVAAKDGHLPVVQYLLSIGAPLSPSVLFSVVDSYRETATSVINLLIEKGADIRATDSNGDTLLHLATHSGIREVECLKRVKILVNAGCDPRVCNSAGRTPFHVAARQRYVLIMEYLLSLGISIPTDVMLSQFDWIISPAPQRYYSATRFLLDKGGDIHTVTKDGDTLLHSAAVLLSEHDALEFAKLFVEAGCNPSAPNSKHELPLHIAARRGYPTVVNYFLSLGVSLPPDILLAASTGYPKPSMFRYLIEKGADVSVVTTDGNGPLHLSVTNGTEGDILESVKFLIDAGCDPRAQNAAKETPMHIAARHGSIPVLEYLLSQGVPLPDDILLTSTTSTIVFLSKKGVDVCYGAANVDMQLMHRALNYYYEEDCLTCAKILIGAGWDPSVRNLAGETPIHVAARRRQLSTVKYLLSHCDNTSLPTDVLLAAVPSDVRGYDCFTGYSVTSLFNFLIYEGANVNAVAPNGDTALHLTLRSSLIINGDYEDWLDLWKAVEVLLSCGADPSARNGDGETPLDIAATKGHFVNENFLRLVRNIRSSS